MNWTFVYMVIMSLIYISFNATIIAFLDKSKDGEFMQSMYGDRFKRSSIIMLSVSCIVLVYLIIMGWKNKESMEFNGLCYSSPDFYMFMIMVNSITLGITSDMIYSITKGPSFSAVSNSTVVQALFYSLFGISLLSVLIGLFLRIKYTRSYVDKLKTSYALQFEKDLEALKQKLKNQDLDEIDIYDNSDNSDTAYDPYAYTLH